MTSMHSKRNVPVPVAGSRMRTKGSLAFTPSGISSPSMRLVTSAHVSVDARPSSRPKFCLQKLVHTAHDVGDHGSWCKEDASLVL